MKDRIVIHLTINVDNKNKYVYSFLNASDYINNTKIDNQEYIDIRNLKDIKEYEVIEESLYWSKMKDKNSVTQLILDHMIKDLGNGYEFNSSVVDEDGNLIQYQSMLDKIHMSYDAKYWDVGYKMFKGNMLQLSKASGVDRRQVAKILIALGYSVGR